MTTSRIINGEICCASCQEPVNVHGCAKCGKDFDEGDTFYCKYHSMSDCEHFHEECMPSAGGDK